MPQPNHRDEDMGKGAVEQDKPGQPTNVSVTGQNPHRDQDPILKSSDSDYPEPGQNPEHSGEVHEANQLEKDSGCNQKAVTQEQDDPGHRQKENQNQSKDDPLAA